MFEDIKQSDTAPVAWRYLAHGKWSVTNIKGAAEFWQSEGCVVEPLYTILAQSDAERMPDDNFERHQNARISKLEHEIAAFTQSDAEPVAWRYRYKIGGWSGWHVSTLREEIDLELRSCIVPIEASEIEALYTVPPCSNASAGLIEAAKEIERQACRESHFHRAEAFNEAARIIRARAADRSGK